MTVVKAHVPVNYPDNGCAVYLACLECPLPRCIEEMPRAMQNIRLLRRAIEVNKLHKQGKSISDIASRLKVSTRTVRRAMAIFKPETRLCKAVPSGTSASSKL